MKPPKPPKQPKPAKPLPGVMPDDHLFFRVAGQPRSGRVLSIGKDGVMVECDGQHPPGIRCDGRRHKALWDEVIAHKRRSAQTMRVVDSGEDGAILQSDRGHRVFAHGWEEPMAADFGDNNKKIPVKDFGMHKAKPIALFFSEPDVIAKAIKNAPGLALRDTTDKLGHQTKRWMKVSPDQPAGQHNVMQGDSVKFQMGSVPGEGKIHAAGKDGATVRDESGRAHDVHWHEMTHHAPAGGEGGEPQSGTSAPAEGKPAAAAPGGGGGGGKGGDGGGTGGGGGDGGEWSPERRREAAIHRQPIPADKFSAAEFGKVHDDAKVTPEDILASTTKEKRAKAETAAAKVKTVKQTQEEYKKEGKYSPERQKIHDKIISRYLNPKAVAAATPPLGQKPTFTLLGGRGGSGKSWFNGNVYDKGKAISLDADEIKGMLPEYRGWNAHQVHEESSDLFDDITSRARAMGLNIVHDSTMKTAPKAVKLVKEFKDRGYRIETYYMHLPRQMAAKRALKRFTDFERKEHHPADMTGRFVPPEVVLGNTGNEAAFDEVRKHADKWGFYDNNNPGEGKSPPVLIAEHGEPQGKPEGVEEDRPEHPAAPGEPFVAYRAGHYSEQSLANRNAGDSYAVAKHLADIDDDEGGISSHGEPTHVHAWRVRVHKPFGEYERRNFGAEAEKQKGGGDVVGRGPYGNGTAHSFPSSGQGFDEEYLGSVPISELRQSLKDRYPEHDYGGNFADHGWDAGAEAIRNAKFRRATPGSREEDAVEAAHGEAEREDKIRTEWEAQKPEMEARLAKLRAEQLARDRAEMEARQKERDKGSGGDDLKKSFTHAILLMRKGGTAMTKKTKKPGADLIAQNPELFDFADSRPPSESNYWSDDPDSRLLSHERERMKQLGTYDRYIAESKAGFARARARLKVAE